MSQNGKSHICPIDKRQFASKKALAQHRAASHNKTAPKLATGNGGRRPGNARMGKFSNQVNSTSRSISGVDIIGTFPIAATAQAGSVVMGGPLSPTFLEATRIHAEASLWSRWKPIKMRLEFISSAGAMTSGSLVSGWTINPDLWLKDDLSSISTVAAFASSAQFHISKRFSINIPCSMTRTWYLNDSKADMIDQCHGKFFAVLASGIGNVTGSSTFTYTVRLHYTILFDTPMLPKAAEDIYETVYANSGFESYFTDSTSGWASGKILSLKHTAGGALVEFDGLTEGAIYMLDVKATLTAYTSTGATVKVKYMTKIFGQDKHVIVFPGITEAKAYIHDKDVNHGLTFIKAGEVVTPSNPAWLLVVPPPKVSSESYSELQYKMQQLETKFSQLLAATAGSSTLGVGDITLRNTARESLQANNRVYKVASAHYGRFQQCSEVDPITGIGVHNIAGLVPLQPQVSEESEVGTPPETGWDMGN